MIASGSHSLTIVAAVARNGVIGVNGRLPWHLPGDLRHFRDLTWGHPLLMGRLTFESIGRVLPGRTTTVLSRTPDLAIPGVTVARDLGAALVAAGRQADSLGVPTIMVVGGATLYARTISTAERLSITEVDLSPVGDAVFPPIDPLVWRRVAERAARRWLGEPHGYRFVQWERRRP